MAVLTVEGDVTQRHNNDLRADLATAARVDQGLRIYFQQGLHPAMTFFEEAGVPRAVALRALCSPDHFRQRDRRRFARPGAPGHERIAPVRLAAAAALPSARTAGA